LIEPGSKSVLDDKHTSHLVQREQELRSEGADEILREFGFNEKPVVQQ
jgi:hypothetical protein